MTEPRHFSAHIGQSFRAGAVIYHRELWKTLPFECPVDGSPVVELQAGEVWVAHH